MNAFVFNVRLNGLITELEFNARTKQSAIKKYNDYLWDRNIDSSDILSITKINN
ncbi:MAG: hypothetical protein M0R51_09440 [Clostridia bacterium]|jgi:hypothetical protein|nr:hypothetical protein [Clostridia bacterium]